MPWSLRNQVGVVLMQNSLIQHSQLETDILTFLHYDPLASGEKFKVPNGMIVNLTIIWYLWLIFGDIPVPPEKHDYAIALIQRIISQSLHIHARAAFFPNIPHFHLINCRFPRKNMQGLHDFIIPPFSLQKSHIHLSRKLKNVAFSSHTWKSLKSWIFRKFTHSFASSRHFCKFVLRACSAAQGHISTLHLDPPLSSSLAFKATDTETARLWKAHFGTGLWWL